ncbi:DUF962 domain-containing protein [Vandammella animalimorsus]|uniref:Mpo1 family 2-hydroxy fatty acid dioxygenase n=1 Tax=Vandammella animalimorsus TaxID=2029117 RepID=UPI000BAA5B45|nr:Mpo1-like protein [Vandammella animalimorsus]PAT32636.1 hypothetical protein CK626_02820 [Vandammella animalimorsus]
MKTLEDQLANYAAYHRDPRNIATHFIGIPMIVLAITVLLSRPAFTASGLVASPAVFAAIAASAYYLRLSLGLGLVMTALLALCVWFGAWAAQLSTATWLALGIGGFVVGWIFQFVGHFWEGRKPAFVDDLIGLIIGPLFVVVEALFAAGLLQGLQREVETRSGPVRHHGVR